MPFIGIDFDDVLADTNTTLIRWHNERYKTTLKREDFWSYYYWDVWGGTREEAIAKFDEFGKSEYFHSILPVAGAYNGIADLSTFADRLVIITARDEEMRKVTEQWVSDHLPAVFHSIHFVGALSKNGPPKKSKGDVCKEQNLTALIDDSIEFAASCNALGIPTLIFDTPWNRKETIPSLSKRIMGWREVLPAIKTFF